MFVLSQNKHVYILPNNTSHSPKNTSHIYITSKHFFKKKKKTFQTYHIVLKNYFPLTMHVRLEMTLAFIPVMIFWCSDSTLKYSFP